MKTILTFCGLACAGWLAGCQKSTAPDSAAAPAAGAVSAGQAPVDKAATSRAVVELSPIGSSGVRGQLTLLALPHDAGVKFDGALVGLSPGLHGIHVHEVGNCDSPDGMSAGGHFNPTAAPHGSLEAAASHVGDLGNVPADAQGKASLAVIKGAARLAGPGSLIGRSIIVHQGADDLESQPAGQSGARVSCGVIRAD